MLIRYVTGYRPVRIWSVRRWSVIPTFSLCGSDLLCHPARTVSGGKTLPEISDTTEGPPEFIPRDINPEMENRLSAVLAAREAEGRQMASLFEPDVPEVVSGEDVTPG